MKPANPLPIHPLNRWLFENQIKGGAFAVKAGVRHSMLSEIINWRRQPELNTVMKLCAATGGALTPEQFILPTQTPPS